MRYGYIQLETRDWRCGIPTYTHVCVGDACTFLPQGCAVEDRQMSNPVIVASSRILKGSTGKAGIIKNLAKLWTSVAPVQP